MTITPYHNTNSSKKKQVADMFNHIAPRYDFLNHFLSLGIDVLWRRKVIQLLQKGHPKQILDIATGTGDFAMEAMKLHPEKVTGIDIAENMLQKGRIKIKKKQLEEKIELLFGDSENIPFSDNTFDAITAGFGVRNFEHLEKGLSEMYRVLKKDGTLGILEFSTPKTFPFNVLYSFYFNRILPMIGKWISKDNNAYSYLPESVRAFPDGQTFLQLLANAGFTELKLFPLTFGIATIYIGKKG